MEKPFNKIYESTDGKKRRKLSNFNFIRHWEGVYTVDQVVIVINNDNNIQSLDSNGFELLN